MFFMIGYENSSPILLLFVVSSILITGAFILSHVPTLSDNSSAHLVKFAGTPEPQ